MFTFQFYESIFKAKTLWFTQKVLNTILFQFSKLQMPAYTFYRKIIFFKGQKLIKFFYQLIHISHIWGVTLRKLGEISMSRQEVKINCSVECRIWGMILQTNGKMSKRLRDFHRNLCVLDTVGKFLLLSHHCRIFAFGFHFSFRNMINLTR